MNQEVSFPMEYSESQSQYLLNSVMLGFDYTGLLGTLSSKYCMCDFFEGYVDYQPFSNGLVDLTKMLDQESSMSKVRNSLSTLQIPKASYATNCEEQLTPSTLEASPRLRRQGEGSFSQYSKAS